MLRILNTIFFLLLLGCQSAIPDRSPQSLGFVNKLEEYYYNEIFLGKRNYNEIKKISLEVLKHCADSNCVMVGVGRSPTPILSFMDALLPKKAINLPLSNFRFNTTRTHTMPVKEFDAIVDQNKEYQYSLPHKFENKLFRHFDNFVNYYDLEGKRIVLFDVSNQSILSVYSYFQKYIQKRNLSIELDVVQIADKESEGILNYIRDDYKVYPHIVYLEDRRTSMSFKLSKYDAHAPHGSFDVMKDELKEISKYTFRPYKRLKEAFLSKIKADPELLKEAAFLIELNPSCHKMLEYFLN